MYDEHKKSILTTTRNRNKCKCLAMTNFKTISWDYCGNQNAKVNKSWWRQMEWIYSQFLNLSRWTKVKWSAMLLQWPERRQNYWLNGTTLSKPKKENVENCLSKLSLLEKLLRHFIKQINGLWNWLHQSQNKHLTKWDRAKWIWDLF